MTLADEKCHLQVLVCQLVIVIEYRPPWWGELVKLLVLHSVFHAWCSSSSITKHYRRCITARSWWYVMIGSIELFLQGIIDH